MEKQVKIIYYDKGSKGSYSDIKDKDFNSSNKFLDWFILNFKNIEIIEIIEI